MGLLSKSIGTTLLGGYMLRDYLQRKLSPKMISPVPETQPKPSVTPTASPAPTGYFNYEPYRKSGNFKPSQPPPKIATSIWKEFPNEATQAALVAATENQRFDPNAYNFNPKDKSGDYGIMQVNNRTLEDTQKYYPNTTKRMGVSSVEDLKNPEKNIKLSKLIKNRLGWGAWYGPKNKGFDLGK